LRRTIWAEIYPDLHLSAMGATTGSGGNTGAPARNDLVGERVQDAVEGGEDPEGEP